MVKYFNLKMVEKEPTFKVGDWVIVNAKNIKTRCPTKKLDYKLHGKFRIKRLRGMNTYELELPPSTGKIHPVFYISLLEPYHLNNIPGRCSPTPRSVDLEETENHVEKIRTSQLRKGRVWYLVSWKVMGRMMILGSHMTIYETVQLQQCWSFIRTSLGSHEIWQFSFELVLFLL